MKNIVMLYVPFSNQLDAIKLLKILMQKKLVTCGNIAAPHVAVYPWKGEICEESEVAAWFKTTAAKADEAIRFIREHHPYDLPSILKIDAQALPDYARWLEDSNSV